MAKTGDRRPYDNSSRLKSAEETRSAIIEAARARLVEGGGYGALTMAAVASAAQVSPQTIYNTVGGKAALVKAAYDMTLAGDSDPTPMSERREFRALTDASDPAAFARAYAVWCRLISERTGHLIAILTTTGGAGDPDVADFLATIERERRTGTTHAVTAFASRFGLPPGVTLRSAVDMVWTLNSPMIHDRLVRSCGWTSAAYETWLAGQVLASVGGRS